MIAKNIRGVSYLNLELRVRRRDLIRGRMDLGGWRMDLGGRGMDLGGRRRRNLIGAIKIGNVNFAGALGIFVRFFRPPPVNLATMQRHHLMSRFNFAGTQGIHFIFLVMDVDGVNLDILLASKYVKHISNRSLAGDIGILYELSAPYIS